MAIQEANSNGHVQLLAVAKKNALLTVFFRIRNTIVQFASKWNSKAFDYCSCEGFAQTLGKKSQFVSGALQMCNKPNILSFEELEVKAQQLEGKAMELESEASSLENM
jgi:hypothetical protein